MHTKQTDEVRPWALAALSLALIVLIWAGLDWLWNPFEREALFHARRIASSLSLFCLAVGLLYHHVKSRVVVFVSASMLLMGLSIVIEFLMES